MAGQRVDSAKAPEPVGPYPHARRVGNLLFLSGVGPRRRGDIQAGILSRLSATMDRIEDLDLALADRLVVENLEPLAVPA